MMVKESSALPLLVEPRIGDEFAIRAKHMQKRFDLAFTVDKASH